MSPGTNENWHFNVNELGIQNSVQLFCKENQNKKQLLN